MSLVVVIGKATDCFWVYYFLDEELTFVHPMTLPCIIPGITGHSSCKLPIMNFWVTARESSSKNTQMEVKILTLKKYIFIFAQVLLNQLT